MQQLRTYLVISTRGAVHDTIYYSTGQTFTAKAENVTGLIAAGDIEELLAPLTPDTVTSGTEALGPIGIGPTGATGPPGPANGPYNVTARITDLSLALTDQGTFYTNTGASADMIFTLPALVALGERYLFTVTANHYVRINNLNGSSTINYGATTGAAGGYIRSTAIGSFVEVISAAAGKWITRAVGTWTVDS